MEDMKARSSCTRETRRRPMALLAGAVVIASSTLELRPSLAAGNDRPEGSSAATASTPASGGARPGPREAWKFENPFATAYDDGPGPFRVGLHVGSVHRDGLGPSLTLVPWEYLRATVTYGYRTQHSMAGALSVPIFPRAALTPYATAGYALAVAALPQGIHLFSHQLVTGLGFEARVLDRYVLGAEMTGNWIFRQTLQEKTESHVLRPGVPLTVQGGFHLGVYLP